MNGAEEEWLVVAWASRQPVFYYAPTDTTTVFLGENGPSTLAWPQRGTGTRPGETGDVQAGWGPRRSERDGCPFFPQKILEEKTTCRFLPDATDLQTFTTPLSDFA